MDAASLKVAQFPVLARTYAARQKNALTALQKNRALAACIVFITIAVAYGVPRASHLVFFAALPLFVLQAFASVEQVRLFALSRALRSVSGGLPPERIKGKWLAGAALAVRDAYFILFLCFDGSWLLYDLLRPTFASSFEQYVGRLSIGLLPGAGLLAFTVVFWLCYAVLLAYGQSIAREVSQSLLRSSLPPELVQDLGITAVERVPFSAEVTIWEGIRIRLNGFRMPRTSGAQTLILWPGFTQNGYVYDLFPGPGSLGEYLWQRGFDVWVFHSRGTGGSDGRRQRCSLDDFAAFDIPAAIRFVSARVDAPPVFVGHSMGGIAALLSMMGLERLPAGSTRLTDVAAGERQKSLRALVTLGSFPDFAFSKESGLQRFVRGGVELSLFGARLHIPVQKLLPFLRGFTFLGIPVDLRLRQSLAQGRALRVLLLPLYGVLELVAQLGFWEFLYHLPNVTRSARRHLFFATIDGTFWDVVDQYQGTVLRGQMVSRDERVNYSENYARINLPISVVGMEFDSLADLQCMRTSMFERLSSTRKFYSVWKGVGHEDCFMDAKYFPEVEEAIRLALG